MDLFIIIFRTIYFYFFIVLVYRIMGKREIGQLGIIDLIVSILIAELVAISIEKYTQNIMFTIIPVCILVFLEIGFAFISLKSKTVHKILDGKTSLIIYGGKLNYKEMVKQRYSLDDLLLSLRQKQVKSIEEIEFAFLENNGRLSIFKYELDKNKSAYPMPLIVDGLVNTDALKKSNKSKTWLKGELSKKSLMIEEVFYAFYKNKRLFVIKKAELLK